MIPNRKSPFSLTARVMSFVALAIGVSLIFIGNLVHSAVEQHFAEQDAEELQVMTNAVAQALSQAKSEQFSEILAHAVSGHHGVYFQVWNQRDQLIYGPNGGEFIAPIKRFKAAKSITTNTLLQWQADAKIYRGAISESVINEKKYRIVSAINMNFHIQFLENFRHSLWLIMTLAGALTLLAAWYGVHQGLAPVRGLSDAMSDVQADRLHLRLEPATVPAELKALVASFNHMISRLEDSFTRLSHFSADIAHELRTPLTNLITQTQVALGKIRSADEYAELLYSNLEEQERLAKMVNDMLWLAQSEQGLVKPAREALNLAQEVRDLFDFFSALAEEKAIRLQLHGQAPNIQADRSLVRRALSNLLSNAIRHTPKGETIHVYLDEAVDGNILLCVQNPGPKIATQHLAKIFERFYRVDPSRTRQSEGAGLGLAIVRSIIDAHGGRVEASSDLKATRFTLFFQPQ